MNNDPGRRVLPFLLLSGRGSLLSGDRSRATHSLPTRSSLPSGSSQPLAVDPCRPGFEAGLPVRQGGVRCAPQVSASDRVSGHRDLCRPRRGDVRRTADVDPGVVDPPGLGGRSARRAYWSIAIWALLFLGSLLRLGRAVVARRNGSIEVLSASPSGCSAACQLAPG